MTAWFITREPGRVAAQLRRTADRLRRDADRLYRAGDRQVSLRLYDRWTAAHETSCDLDPVVDDAPPWADDRD